MQVENESGLSNFIPVLFGDKEVCSEMRIIQQVIDDSFSNSDFPGTKPLSETIIWRQGAISEFLVDVGWLLKEPSSENLHHSLSASQIQQLAGLLNFLMENGSTVILEKILLILRNLMAKFEVNSGNGGSHGANIDVLMKKVEFARDFLRRRHEKMGGLVLHSQFSALKSPNDVPAAIQVDQARMSLPKTIYINYGSWIFFFTI